MISRPPISTVTYKLFPYTTLFRSNVYCRSRLEWRSLARLANADAFRSLGLDRRAALWAVQSLGGEGGGRGAVEDLPLFAGSGENSRDAPLRPFQDEAEVELPAMPLGEHVVEDYRALSLSLKAHPVSFLRDRLAARRVLRACDLAGHPANRPVRVAGLVLVRQRPGTASGVIFMTLEDETGIANAIVWPKVFEQWRREVLSARLVVVEGMLQKRSEEHTSELQSLMRISYAVFCLKKKKIRNNLTTCR